MFSNLRVGGLNEAAGAADAAACADRAVMSSL